MTFSDDGLQVQAVGQSPGSLGGVAFDGVGQSVHAGGSGQALGHGGHHVGVNNGDIGNIINVDADELTLALHVGDNVVDGSFGSGAGGGGNSDGEDGGVLGRSNAFQRTDICKLGVIDDDADVLSGIH